METKHTKGKWHYTSNDNNGNYQIETQGERFAVIAKLNQEQVGNTGRDFIKIEEDEANAKLIASAPELLNSCIEMWEWIMKQDDWRGDDPKKEWKESILKAIK